MTHRPHLLTSFQSDQRSLVRVHLLLLAFSAYLAATALREMTTFWMFTEREPVHLMWPLLWAKGLTWEPVGIAIVAAFVVVTVVALVAYRHRPVRVAVFVVLLLHASMLSSFGKVNHGFHHPLIAAFFLALVPTLPRIGDDIQTSVRDRVYRWILAAQAVVLLTYSLSGFWKLREGIEVRVAGRAGLFSTRSLAALVSHRAIQTSENPPLADFIVNNATVSSLLYLATVGVELTALVTVVVPRLSAVWALALIGFHLAVFWSMQINFTHSIATLAVLFLLSPFLPGRRTERIE